MKKKTLMVDNMGNFEFWLGCFKPRTQKWQRETLHRLKTKANLFDNEKETPDKIRALQFLLNN